MRKPKKTKHVEATAAVSGLRYNYATPAGWQATADGEIIHPTSSAHQMRIDYTDLDGQNNSAAFATVAVGDTLTIDTATWEITTVGTGGKHFPVGVTPTNQQLPAGEYLVSIAPPAPPEQPPETGETPSAPVGQLKTGLLVVDEAGNIWESGGATYVGKLPRSNE